MFDEDYHFNPTTGNDTLDKIDQLKIDVPNATTQGTMSATNFGTHGYFEGKRVYKQTPRKRKASLHRQVNAEIEVKFR